MARRKVAMTIYLQPDDPLIAYLERFRDRSQAAIELMRLGHVTVTGAVTPQGSVASVTVTKAGPEEGAARMTVTSGGMPDESRLGVTVTDKQGVTVTEPEEPGVSRPGMTVTSEDVNADWG